MEPRAESQSGPPRCARIVLAVAFLALALAAPAQAATRSVCPSGCPYATVQAGVDGAFAGDTVSIAPGTYVEQVTVAKPIVLAPAAAGVVLQAPPAPASACGPPAVPRVAVLCIHDVTGAVLRGVVVDGAGVGGVTGVALVNAAGDLAGLAVHDADVGIAVDAAAPTTITSSSLTRNRQTGLLADRGEVSITASLVADAPGAKGIVARARLGGRSVAVDATGDTITGLSGGLVAQDDDPTDGAVPDLTARFDRIAANAVGVAVNGSRQADARNDWWGCNTGPDTPGCDTTAGPVAKGPWLTLDLAAAASRVVPGDSSGLVASLRRNSDGDLFASPPFPATPIAFGTDAGTVLTPARTDRGAAASRFTAAAAPGTAHVTASLDGQSVTAPVDVVAPPAPGPWLDVPSRRVTVSATGIAPLVLRCLQPAASCGGRLVLSVRVPAGGRRTRTVVLARTSFLVDAGGTSILLPLVSPGAQRLLRRSGRVLSGTAAVSGRDASGQLRALTQRLAVRPTVTPAKKKRATTPRKRAKTPRKRATTPRKRATTLRKRTTR